MTGIYKITNKLNNKSYIGQAQDIETRFKQHRYALTDSNKSWYPEARSESNSLDDFDFLVLQECSVNELDELEEYWINYYDSYNNGYNKTKDGQNKNPPLIITGEYDLQENAQTNFYKIPEEIFISINYYISGKNGSVRTLLYYLIFQHLNNNFYLTEQKILKDCNMVHSRYVEARKYLVENNLITYIPFKSIAINYSKIAENKKGEGK